MYNKFVIGWITIKYHWILDLSCLHVFGSSFKLTQILQTRPISMAVISVGYHPTRYIS